MRILTPASGKKDEYVFQRIAREGLRRGISNQDLQKAREWYREAAYAVKAVSVPKLFKSAYSFQKTSLSFNSIGKMYTISYPDPKWKAQLDMYDIVPLIIPIEIFDNGNIFAINFHYLPVGLRAKLMDSLYEIANNNKWDSSTKLNISYRFLKSFSQWKLVKPCLHSYIPSRIAGPALFMPADYWDTALFLPTARFRKMNEQNVHARSLYSIGS